jgi:hypothetical protein
MQYLQRGNKLTKSSVADPDMDSGFFNKKIRIMYARVKKIFHSFWGGYFGLSIRVRLHNSAKSIKVLNRVADPNSFHPDPDPAFLGEYRSGSRGLMTKN